MSLFLILCDYRLSKLVESDCPIGGILYKTYLQLCLSELRAGCLSLRIVHLYTLPSAAYK